MVPRHEVERYASQPTDDAHTKEVGTHVATSGEMEPSSCTTTPPAVRPTSARATTACAPPRPWVWTTSPAREPLQLRPARPRREGPQDHPAIAAGGHVPADIYPSHIGLTAVDKPAIPEGDLRSARNDYNLTGRPAWRQPTPRAGQHPAVPARARLASPRPLLRPREEGPGPAPVRRERPDAPDRPPAPAVSAQRLLDPEVRRLLAVLGPRLPHRLRGLPLVRQRRPRRPHRH